jgi:hypothetical protein
VINRLWPYSHDDSRAPSSRPFFHLRPSDPSADDHLRSVSSRISFHLAVGSWSLFVRLSLFVREADIPLRPVLSEIRIAKPSAGHDAPSRPGLQVGVAMDGDGGSLAGVRVPQDVMTA